jgi:hypothetical protein
MIMIKKLWIIVLTVMCSFAFGQIEDKNLNAQLHEMRGYFLSEDLDSYCNYVYPKVIEIMGGKANLIKATRGMLHNMKKDGFTITNLSFKNPSAFLKKGDELQCTVTQIIVMDTPEGKIESEYTLIGISTDNGKKWKFIDTSGKDKATMQNYFPNLHDELVIKPKKQRRISG